MRPFEWLYNTDECDGCGEAPPKLFERTLENRARLLEAARWAVRATTDCGRIDNYDPDALVLNIIYAMCGPREVPTAIAQADAVEA